MFGNPDRNRPSEAELLHLFPKRGAGHLQELRRLADLPAGALQRAQDMGAFSGIARLGKAGQAVVGRQRPFCGHSCARTASSTRADSGRRGTARRALRLSNMRQSSQIASSGRSLSGGRRCRPPKAGHADRREGGPPASPPQGPGPPPQSPASWPPQARRSARPARRRADARRH